MKPCTTLTMLSLVLLLGSSACSKKDLSETSATPPTDRPNILGNWTAGFLSDTQKRLADTAKPITTMAVMAFSNWTFKPGGGLVVGDGSTSATLAFTTLPDNRIVLSVNSAVDTFTVTTTGKDGLLLTTTRPMNGFILTESLQLHRNSN
jgi:hypothetical protein